MAATLLETNVRSRSATPIHSATSASEDATSAKAPAPLSPGKRLPHPVVFKILARRRVKAAASRRPLQAVHPVASMLLARRWMKTAAKNRKRGDDEMARRQVQQVALGQELAWQRGSPLCFENVARLYPDMRDVVLGNRIFRLIELTDAVHPGKVTGMILEGLSTREIYDLLHTEEPAAAAHSILTLVDEAHEVLRTWEEAQGQGEKASKGLATADGEAAGASADPSGEDGQGWQLSEERSEGEQRDEWQVVQTKRRRSPSTA